MLVISLLAIRRTFDVERRVFARTTTLENATRRLFFGRSAGKICLPVFLFFTCFVILQVVPEWSVVDWPLSIYEGMFLAAIGGAIYGQLAAERRFAGAFALGIGGIGAVAAVELILLARTFMTVIPNQRVAVLFMGLGFLPSITLYWLIERIFGRPADAVDVAAARKRIQDAMAVMRERRRRDDNDRNDSNSEAC